MPLRGHKEHRGVIYPPLLQHRRRQAGIDENEAVDAQEPFAVLLGAAVEAEVLQRLRTLGQLAQLKSCGGSAMFRDIPTYIHSHSSAVCSREGERACGRVYVRSSRHS